MGKFWDRFKDSLPTNSVVLKPVEKAKPEVNAVINIQPVELSSDGTLLKPTCAITKNRSKMSDSFDAMYNPQMNLEPFGHLFPTKKTQRVYVFNVSAQEFRVSRSPLFKSLLIPAKKASEEYAVCFSLPQPMPIPRANVDSFVSEIVWEDARRVAMDVVNPDNLGVDPKKMEVKFSTGYGSDLSLRGVFWSTHEKPTKTEIKMARQRMEKYYRALLERIWVLQVAGASLKGEITPEHHFAAEYFKQSLPWHPRRPDTKASEKIQTQGA